MNHSRNKPGLTIPGPGFLPKDILWGSLPPPAPVHHELKALLSSLWSSPQATAGQSLRSPRSGTLQNLIFATPPKCTHVSFLGGGRVKGPSQLSSPVLSRSTHTVRATDSCQERKETPSPGPWPRQPHAEGDPT